MHSVADKMSIRRWQDLFQQTMKTSLPHSPSRRTNKKAYSEMEKPYLVHRSASGIRKLAKVPLNPACQYKEHKYGSMHGYQCIIKFRLNLSTFGPFAQEYLPAWEKLNQDNPAEAEQHRHQTTDNRPDHTGNQELLSRSFYDPG